MRAGGVRMGAGSGMLELFRSMLWCAMTAPGSTVTDVDRDSRKWLEPTAAIVFLLPATSVLTRPRRPTQGG